VVEQYVKDLSQRPEPDLQALKRYSHIKVAGGPLFQLGADTYVVGDILIGIEAMHHSSLWRVRALRVANIHVCMDSAQWKGRCGVHGSYLPY
jgi:hypothetical protein